MAFEGPQIRIPGLKAGADLSAASNQFKFVKLDANGDVVLASVAGEAVVGVLQNTPASGAEAIVAAAGVTKLQADGALNEGDKLATSADGQALAALGTHNVVGQALTASGAAGEVIAALVNCMSPTLNG